MSAQQRVPSVQVDWERHQHNILTLPDVMEIAENQLHTIGFRFPTFRKAAKYWRALELRRNSARGHISHTRERENLTDNITNSPSFDENEVDWIENHNLKLSKAFMDDIRSSPLPCEKRRLILFDTYEHIDFYRHSTGKKNFCQEWVMRLAWELPADTLFVISGRENHSDQARSIFSNCSREEVKSKPLVVHSVAVSEFSHSDVAKVIKAKLSAEARKTSKRSIPRFARQIKLHSRGIPLFAVLLVDDLVHTIEEDGEWSIDVAENATFNEARTAVVRRLLRFASRDANALLAVKLAAIVQVGNEPDLEKQVLDWGLKNDDLDRIASSYSSLFGQTNTLHPEIRDAIAELLLSEHSTEEHLSLWARMADIREELLRRIRAIEANAMQGFDQEKLSHFYAMLLTIEPWLDADSALTTLLRVVLLHTNLSSVQEAALSDSPDHLPNSDIHSLSNVLELLNRTRADAFIKSFIREEYRRLLDNPTHSNLLQFLQRAISECSDEYVRSAIEVTMYTLQITIHGRGQSQAIDYDSIERELKAATAKISDEVDHLDLLEFTFLQAWISLSQYYKEKQRTKRQQAALEQALLLSEPTTPIRKRLSAKLHIALAGIAISTDDPELYHSQVGSVEVIDSEDSWLNRQLANLRSGAEDKSQQLVRLAENEEQRNHTITNETIELLNLAIAFAPNSSYYLQKVVSILRRSGEYQRALGVAAQLVNKEPNSVQAYLAQGLVLYELGRFDEANECFATAERWQKNDQYGLPSFLNLYTNLGHVALMLDNLEEARTQYEKRISLGLRKVEGIRAAAFRGSQKLANTQQKLLRHVRVWLAYVLLALDGEDHRELAKKLWYEVLKADPSYHQAAAGLYLIEPKNVDLLVQALKHCTERMQSAPHDLSYKFHKAELELLKGDLRLDTIIDLFEAAVASAGDAKAYSYISLWFLELASRCGAVPPEALVKAREVLSADRSERAEVLAEDKAAMVEHYEDGTFRFARALVIGVANYPNIGQLPDIVLKDATDLASILTSREHCGYPTGKVDVLLDENATAANIRLALQRLGEAAIEEDTVVVFFSGHGGIIERSGVQRAYVLPYDFDIRCIEETAIDCDEVTNLLRKIRARRLLVLLDACHSGGAAELKGALSDASVRSGLDEKTYERLAEGTGRVLISSSRTEEVSLILHGMKNSLFTHYLLDGLKGMGTAASASEIRVFDLFDYISENVPLKANQHPIFKAHDVENNFPIALRAGGKSEAGEASNAKVSVDGHLSGHARVKIQDRLVDRWKDLADYLEISQADTAKFERGDEPRAIFAWLDARNRMHDLRGAFTDLGWKDLLSEFDD